MAPWSKERAWPNCAMCLLERDCSAILLQTDIDGGAGGEDVLLAVHHDPLHLLERPIEEPVGAVIVAALDDLGGVHAGAIDLAFGQVAGLHHVGQHLVGAGARGSHDRYGEHSASAP